jgi:polysaccharide export outer membrane protein
LAQNDVVYVEPNQNKINGAALANTGVIISITSILLTLITLIITTTKNNFCMEINRFDDDLEDDF